MQSRGDLPRAVARPGSRVSAGTSGSSTICGRIATFVGSLPLTATVRFVREGRRTILPCSGDEPVPDQQCDLSARLRQAPGQTYLNTWHGTPFKRMGYDMPDGASESANTLRNFLSADFLLSQNEYMTTTMYEDAYRLRGAFTGLGHRRGLSASRPTSTSDDTTTDQPDADRRRDIDPGGGWCCTRRRGAARPSPDQRTIFDEILRTQSHLQDALGAQLPRHRQGCTSPYTSSRKSGAHVAQVLVPNDIRPTRCWRSRHAGDRLLVDLLRLPRHRKPIVFFVPDRDDYGGRSRHYLSMPTQLPGPVYSTIDQSWPTSFRRHRGSLDRAPRRVGADDSHRSRTAAPPARVIDIVFRGARDGYRLVSLADAPRIPADPSRRHAIQRHHTRRSTCFRTSTTTDIECRGSSPRIAGHSGEPGKVDTRATQFIRSGGMNGSKLSHLCDDRNARVRRDYTSGPAAGRDLGDEWTRCFGDSRSTRSSTSAATARSGPPCCCTHPAAGARSGCTTTCGGATQDHPWKTDGCSGRCERYSRSTTSTTRSSRCPNPCAK